MIKGRTLLIALSLKYNNDWHLMYWDITNKTLVEDEWVEKAASVEDEYITIVDADYQDFIKNLSCPPFVIRKINYQDYLRHQENANED